MKKQARFWQPQKDNIVQCMLCPHTCTLKPENHGICGVRTNQSGKLYSLIYGSCSSISVDPIEKKPLYHFLPGSSAFSIGSVGCSFTCAHCQNYSISTAKPAHYQMQELTSEEAVSLAQENNCQSISFTYNEPTIWHEYSFDTAKQAKKQGLFTSYVTNGYINEDPLREIAPYLDAMNIDVKAFHEDFYHNVCKAQLQPVLQTCMLAKTLGIHIELTYLVIPTMNDSIEEITKFCTWVVEQLGNNIPVHFTRFHPDYKMANLFATPIDTLKNIYEVAKQSEINFPYLGNAPSLEHENTFCPKCNNLLIERSGFSTNIIGLNKNKCKKCGVEMPIVIDQS